MNRFRGKQTVNVPRIALTGGIASGKTTVARLFAALGAKLIDTDQIARDIMTPPSPVLDRLVAHFGPAILMNDGSLDRVRLRHIVFTDQDARRDLEAITHPVIHEEIERRSRQSGGPYQLIAIPLLVETGTAEDYDRVLLIDASPEARKQRLMLRDGIDATAADRMLAAQATRAQHHAAAHDVIENEGDLRHLAAQVEALHRRYLALRSSPGDT